MNFLGSLISVPQNDIIALAAFCVLIAILAYYGLRKIKNA
jgi:hypothetical protein